MSDDADAYERVLAEAQFHLVHADPQVDEHLAFLTAFHLDFHEARLRALSSLTLYNVCQRSYPLMQMRLLAHTPTFRALLVREQFRWAEQQEMIRAAAALPLLHPKLAEVCQRCAEQIEQDTLAWLRQRRDDL